MVWSWELNKFLLSPILTMAEPDVDEFSDDEFYENLALDDFDLASIDENERQQLNGIVNNHDSDSDTEINDENVPLFYYTRPQFQWTGEHFRPPSPDFRPMYNKIPGPTRVLESSISPVQCFGFFYTDKILTDICDFTNAFYAKKKLNDPDHNKGEWKDVTINELKTFYAMRMMMDVLKLDRDVHYWHQGDGHFLLNTRFGWVMSRDRFFR